MTTEGEVRRKDSLCRQNFNLEVRKNFFTVRTVPHWNMIPDEIRKQKSVNGFKNAYDRWRKGQPMELTNNEQSNDTQTTAAATATSTTSRN